MDTRARFEEIWPLPEGVEWNAESGEYEPPRYMSESEFDDFYQCASEHNARLDTFTRCQETTAIHLSLIDEMVQEIETLLDSSYDVVPSSTSDLIDRAKKTI